MITILAWSGGISFAYFLAMKKLKLLRVPLLEEIIGLDAAEMGSAVRIKI
jgi:ammonia channel protein AmtB